MPYTVPFKAEPSVDILSPPVVRNESNTFVCCRITSYARSLKDIPVISYNSHHVLPTMSIYIGQGGIVMIFLQLTMGIIAALFIWGVHQADVSSHAVGHRNYTSHQFYYSRSTFVHKRPHVYFDWNAGNFRPALCHRSIQVLMAQAILPDKLAELEQPILSAPAHPHKWGNQTNEWPGAWGPRLI